MFLVRFCNVVAAEIQLTSHQLVEVLQYEYASMRKSMQTRRIKKQLKRKMKEANSYAEWRSLAEHYDNFEGIILQFICCYPRVKFYCPSNLPYSPQTFAGDFLFV